MSGNKAALKAAKAALDASNFDECIQQAEAVIASDANNYNAHLLLGRAQEKKGTLDSAETTYVAASKIKPDDTQALSGLCSVYAAQGAKNVDAYIDTTLRLGQLFADAEDAERCQTAIDKMVGHVRQNGQPAQIRRALAVMLPASPVYHILAGRVPAPAHTYLRLAESLEAEEKQQINQEIAQRRTRIGAKIGQVTTDVKLEVLAHSELEILFKNVIDWTNDDDIRRQYEEKLLQHAYDLLTVLPTGGKAEQLDKVLTLAEGAIIVHHAFQLAWDLYLESRDLDNLQDLDINDLQEYVKFFPEDGLARVMQAWLSSDLSPFGTDEKTDDDDNVLQHISPEDRLLMVTDGIARSERSPFASRLAADFYLSLDEFETAIQTARNGLSAVSNESKKLGLSLQNTRDALNSVLGTALVVYQAPRHHTEARRLLEEILERKPRFTPALIGLGLILEEVEQYANAIQFLEQALKEDSSNMRIGVELAWCKALNGDYTTAQAELEEYLPMLAAPDPKSKKLRAQCLYRIGVCMWQLDDSKAARKDRNGAYARFLSAIKTDVEYAPAYTRLGQYYEQYAKDKKRARQCYQKAFELSPAETEAAERLARSFADQGDWEIVEVVAQRVIDSGRARPPPGSKRKGLSWPYSALGVAQMNKLEYQQAIVSFLAALRINPEDYQSYIGLGESYHNSGRYNSASRTFNHALDSVASGGLQALNETWFARYMLANVHRELGEYDEAIKGLTEVLNDRPTEFGVLLSLLQTQVEKAWRCVETALFGQALQAAEDAITTVTSILKERPHAFNMWKGLGDACLIFSWVQSGSTRFPVEKVSASLKAHDAAAFELLSDVDGIKLSDLDKATGSIVATNAALLAFKGAIHACSKDSHAQAVAWYNLGYAQQRTFACSTAKQGRAHLKAAVRCFKRAIELEAGNAEFWNALGTVTTILNPKVAQHALVRSLHINELNAKVWTNLGVLYMLQHDYELAHQAFGRAQSTDPEYAHAWVGEGLIALMTGNTKTALNDFTHAFEISASWSTITKRQYSISSFDSLLTNSATSNDLVALIQPLFALEQLHMQVPQDLPSRHLAALFLERVGNNAEASDVLQELCVTAEAEYEASESVATLARYAHAKSDVARNQLAVQSFDKAIDNAETALDLSADFGDSGLEAEDRLKLRLSAHMTAGLASNALNKSAEAISMFRSALEESENNPDVVCVLVKMLWAHGGADEKAAARDQLFDCVEHNPEHAGAVTLLGAITALDDDRETMKAIKDDLLTLRTNEKVDVTAKNDIEAVLAAFAGLSDAANDQQTAWNGARAAILVDPADSLAWTQLAELTGEAYPAEMALRSAQKAVPPAGNMASGELGKVFALVGTVGDAQRAISLSPWLSEGWSALGEALTS